MVMNTEQLRTNVLGMMDEMVGDLEKLVAIPSCAFPGFPAEPVNQMAEATVDLLRRAGMPDARKVEVPARQPQVGANRLGVSGDYEINKNLVATATPFALTYSPAPSGLRSDIGGILKIEFMVGVGYRM